MNQPDQHSDVLLISADEELAQLVRKLCPTHARLRCIASSSTSLEHIQDVGQFWIDLDSATPARITTSHRRVYFHSNFEYEPDDLPPGLFIRKPCTPSVVEVLWARVPIHSDRTANTPGDRDALVPGWLLDFQEMDLRKLSRKCTAELPRLLGYRSVSLYLYDSRRGILTLAETNHTRPIDLSVSVSTPNSRLMPSAARDRRILTSADVSTRVTARPGRGAEGRERYNDDACLVAPLVCDDQLAGVLNLSGRAAGTGPVLNLPLETIFSFIARALHHARGFDRARTEARVDGLTGLANYRAFRETLASELVRARRFASPLALIMLDFDGLKDVNDQLGHPAGDTVLRNLAARITSPLRQFDRAARIGGDEFAVILPGTELAGARCVALRILRAVRCDPPRHNDRLLPMSASLGVARHQESWDDDRFIAAADSALYTAKSQGRDRVICLPYEGGTPRRKADRPQPTQAGKPTTD